MNATLDEPQLSAVSSSHSSHDNLDLTNGDMVRIKGTLFAADMQIDEIFNFLPVGSHLSR